MQTYPAVRAAVTEAVAERQRVLCDGSTSVRIGELSIDFPPNPWRGYSRHQQRTRLHYALDPHAFRWERSVSRHWMLGGH